MTPPTSFSIPVYPGVKLDTTIKAILGDAAAFELTDRRTLEELQREHAEVERKIRTSAGTSQQCRGWAREKKRLYEAINTKLIADGFMNGSLVPFIEEIQGRQICRFVPSSDKRRHIRKVACKVFKKHRREFNVSNFDETRETNPRQVRGQEDSKPLKWSRLIVSPQEKAPLEVLKSSPQVARTAPTLGNYCNASRAVGKSSVSG